jgi:protein tyrosine/serine phosphatase
LLALLANVACSASVATSSKVPNLYQVRPGLWRSGQPTTAEQWAELKRLGVARVIKLNFETEGTDDGARAAGLIVHELSIQPDGDTDALEAVGNVFKRPDPARLAEALAILRADVPSGVLVHCTHGQDRTGFVIGQLRVVADGWSKPRAYAEMRRYGFHPLLRGLREAWEAWEVPAK